MLCYKTVELSSGRAALNDHAKGMKHDFLLKISTFFTAAKKLSDKCEKEDKSNQNKKQQILDTCVRNQIYFKSRNNLDIKVSYQWVLSSS